ncbi:hypothetical protein NQ318_010148 [Aromia moschata]|uniref:RNase H type-1 domain-containing protein n=1 Tax=Aromia moschata TaxID=1265417 RepID=A0AAV8XR19_9CUCU|nr:hypothetical protein NQ318_010148 [Aromia moschata]
MLRQSSRMEPSGTQMGPKQNKVWSGCNKQRSKIISDSQAAVKALGAVEIHSQAVKDCMDSLTQLADHNSIPLKWVRGHQGHEGNERADFLSQKGAEVQLIGPGTHLRSGLSDSQEGHKGHIKRKTYLALGESPRVDF